MAQRTLLRAKSLFPILVNPELLALQVPMHPWLPFSLRSENGLREVLDDAGGHLKDIAFSMLKEWGIYWNDKRWNIEAQEPLCPDLFTGDQLNIHFESVSKQNQATRRKKKSQNCKMQASVHRPSQESSFTCVGSKHKASIESNTMCPLLPLAPLQLLIASLTGTITVEGTGFGIWYSGKPPLGWVKSQPPKSSSLGSYQSRKVPGEMRDKPESGMLTTV